MSRLLTILVVFAVIAGVAAETPAGNPANKLKVEILNKGLHPGLDPGLYVCAADHLHIRGTVQNLTKETLVSVKLEGRAYDGDGKLVAKAYPRKLKPLPLAPLKPGQKAEFDLEYRQLVGDKIHQVKKQDVVVIEARH
ncbi:MAG: FxLYD domain-containing protein [Anaerolineae bacterium]